MQIMQMRSVPLLWEARNLLFDTQHRLERATREREQLFAFCVSIAVSLPDIFSFHAFLGFGFGDGYAGQLGGEEAGIAIGIV